MNLEKYGIRLAMIGAEYKNRHHLKNDILAHCRELLHINDTKNITLDAKMKEALDIKFENELIDLLILSDLHTALTMNVDNIIESRIDKFIEKIEISNEYRNELRNQAINEVEEKIKNMKSENDIPFPMDEIINHLKKQAETRFGK